MTATVTAGLRPFFRYYGGKWRSAPRYPAPQFDTIIEPFAGAAGYATRHPDRHVILIDSYEAIAGVWSWLTKVSEADFLALPTSFEPGQTVDDFGLSQEARWFLGFWMNHGAAAPCKTPSKWARQYPEHAWNDHFRSVLAGQLSSIRHWRVIHGDFAQAAPDVEATWFVDPPYSNKAGTYYKHSSKRICFNELGWWARSLRGQVIVCENDGATWLPFEPLFRNRSLRYEQGDGTSRVEALWLGGVGA